MDRTRMPYDFTYGANDCVTLELPPGSLIAACASPRGRPVADVSAAVAAALACPLNFPPLASSVVPGDKVVLALDPGVPQAAAIVAAMVAMLEGAGVGNQDVTVLRVATDVEDGADDPRDALPPAIRREVSLETHDPADRRNLSYLAAAQDASPIYLNRRLGEADFVIPITCLRLDSRLGYRIGGTGLYPTFSDVQARGRFRSPAALGSSSRRRRLQHHADQVDWLLGVSFMVGIVPGPRDEVLQVVAGEASAVLQRGSELCAAAWEFVLPQRANFVLAGLSGGQTQQTWDNVGRALAAAMRVVCDDGAVAVCTDLAVQPGPAMQRIVAADDPGIVAEQIGTDLPVDALAATELLAALGRVRVYLLSHLDNTVVEGLGIAPIAGPAEITRLVSRQSSCILLANAQHILATVANEMPAHVEHA